MSWPRRRAEDLVLAAMVLTRLPVGRWSPREQVPLSRGVWAYPLVGGVVGGLGGCGYGLAAALNLPPPLAAGWALLLLLLLTGALHEDGLADVADGFGGGRTAARKLEIMRDSRIGSYGALALILSLGVRAAAMVALADPAVVLAALIASGALGRGAILLVLRFGSPARPDGLAALLGRPDAVTTGTGLVLALAGCALLNREAAVAAAAVTVGGAAAMIGLARRQVGGHTGDVLGATEQVAELLVLTALTAILVR